MWVRKRARVHKRGFGSCKPLENGADSGLCRHTNNHSAPCEALSFDRIDTNEVSSYRNNFIKKFGNSDTGQIYGRNAVSSSYSSQEDGL